MSTISLIGKDIFDHFKESQVSNVALEFLLYFSPNRPLSRFKKIDSSAKHTVEVFVGDIVKTF